ncbi:S41 family peptidase [Anaerosalibacter bizertensis]|uniref:S41 family peptidase n=1 Tax=Anaerosalibacter bizertensis TaxID=932217 RepID=A0A9Q4ACG1_9FIRM|nr:S41 family peptidase [Anaerosalibacter bizertensis]MBV1817048.1 S41 family peptidase [Bacteroidales bacterium MSK.15.36]MCB5560294.1 S41 family peptidase [Anaerosalibacter bizertensis]MCG4564812.1 S41 family peptidase [Anaerosalibacter bizertensis]MCG4582182.1 S41 family peptidase [Anaerosalibacter bizertensis]MCG4585806.1 S41 family peptidase [Anaerosalibacter bizertensis]
MSKKKATTFTIILVLVTNIATFTISNLVPIPLNKKVIIPKNEYEELSSVYKKYSKVMTIEESIKKNFLKDVKDEKLMDGQLKGMVESLEDPYSTYMTKAEFDDFMEHTKGIYGGIGVIVSPGEDNLITVVSPIEDTPGEKAGLKTGDKIIKIDGKEFTADKMDAAVKLMKGKPGTDVVLTILRKDKDKKAENLELKIKREEIRLKSVKAQMLEDKIGYIKITSFDDLTYKDFKKEFETLEKDEAKGIILDLRNNPGGLLDVCADIADEFLGEGTIVYTEDKNGEREYLNSDKGKTDLPLVVLVNEGSASASEILAGAIKDTDRGVLVGTKTFGKGIVQRIIKLPDGSGYKLTVSEYFTPNGTNIHGIGIKPNVEVKLPEDIDIIGPENLNKDIQLKKAIEIMENTMNKK